MMIRDEELGAIRALIAEIQTQVPQPSHGSSMLRVAWDKLVAQLAIRPAPRLRTCPTCGTEGMHDATLCAGCWSKLTPVLEPERIHRQGE